MIKVVHLEETQFNIELRNSPRKLEKSKKSPKLAEEIEKVMKK